MPPIFLSRLSERSCPGRGREACAAAVLFLALAAASVDCGRANAGDAEAGGAATVSATGPGDRMELADGGDAAEKGPGRRGDRGGRPKGGPPVVVQGRSGGLPAGQPAPGQKSAAPTGGWRRGQVLSSGAGGQPLPDYGRFRLRQPPPGYSYRRVGDQAYLVSDETGMIFEVVPLDH